MDVKLTINGEEKSASVPPETTLLRLLLEEFNLTGAKIGCDVGDCGACTVIVDGIATNSCLMLAGQVQGRTIETIEAIEIIEIIETTEIIKIIKIKEITEMFE